uniref:DUF6868 domain-containing protein n=1 Tax=Candidatus Kentrum sp. MB TaxID=2138164 RepID=A0A450XB91_9GAMM|nr:MAG: hypothetical protein BECKMB1821G_GA0114241_100352 [Candidatus Kentron sp. MB]VFK26565.1 MAG: hypothetical protein BECKMB1821I_GA0114274_100138 [Candidatus Kentron sp. MB]VFK74545.1 MAG: hypothetical protein BECKMB1821H_GA0114242_100636 [Candidatus Kentron sp. MB]
MTQETLETLRAVFGWCSVINLTILVVWFLLVTAFRDATYRWEKKWLRIPSETAFDLAHYIGKSYLELTTLIFFVVPYFALVIVT